MTPNFVFGILSSRSLILFASTTFSILVVMLMVGIISVDDVSKILNLSPDSAQILRNAIENIREVWNHVADIISQLLNKLFSFAGVDVDLSKIEFDVNKPVPQTIPINK